jgi:hypothetical protein
MVRGLGRRSVRPADAARVYVPVGGGAVGGAVQLLVGVAVVGWLVVGDPVRRFRRGAAVLVRVGPRRGPGLADLLPRLRL